MRAFRMGLGLLVLCSCQHAFTQDGSVIPLRTLHLYETGVGYFERAGRVTSSTSLPVPAGHLDDALKTLVVLSPGEVGAVSGLEFKSSISRGMARALAGLPPG